MHLNINLLYDEWNSYCYNISTYFKSCFWFGRILSSTCSKTHANERVVILKVNLFFNEILAEWDWPFKQRARTFIRYLWILLYLHTYRLFVIKEKWWEKTQIKATHMLSCTIRILGEFLYKFVSRDRTYTFLFHLWPNCHAHP